MITFVTIAEAVYGSRSRRWVASCCITFGYPLLTLDRKHFEPLAVSGLRLF
jgi:hypothetical protein